MTVRTIRLRRDVMARNDELADRIRRRLARANVASINLISSPGSGKTTLLERTLTELDGEIPTAVVTGDVQTSRDAERLARHTGRLVQAVETEGGCHLDARQIHAAIEALDLDEIRLLLIENVGNLVCPAGWDLGEEQKVVVLSVTEGEDKPLKYPGAFRRSRRVVLNKVDLLPHLDFEVDRMLEYARRINPELELFPLSAKTGEGLDAWFDFLRRRVAAPQAA